jgi:hypothetical protein
MNTPGENRSELPSEVEPTLGHIHIRTTMERKSAYVRAAKPRTLVQWITEALDKAAGYNPESGRPPIAK